MFGAISLSLPLNCSPISFSISADVHVEQRGQRADIDDVLEQLALARLGVVALQIAVSGTPITVMSARKRLAGSGLVES